MRVSPTAIPRALVRFLAAAALSACAALAQAVPLLPGEGAALPGTTVDDEPQLAGVVLVDDLVAFSFDAYGGTVSGVVQVSILRSDLDGTLDFYWRVFNDAGSAGAIGSFRIGEFNAGLFNVNWRRDGLGDVAPDFAYRFPAPLGGYVNFDFANGLLPGQSSSFFFVDTDATAYALNAFYDLTNIGQTQISSLFPMYGPAAAAVSEPGSLLLLAGALLAGFGVRRRSS
jgi:hypothetical protein